MDKITSFDPYREANRNVIWEDDSGDFWYYVPGAGWTYACTGAPENLKRQVQASARPWTGGVNQILDMPWTPWGLWIDGKAHKGFDIPAVTSEPGFVVKDSGAREEYANGFVRDTEDGKYDYARILRIEGLHLIPIEALERWGAHMVKGAAKYGEDNWKQARGPIAIARFVRSLCRHVVQFIRKDRTEDHAAAVCFNVWAAELTPEQELEA